MEMHANDARDYAANWASDVLTWLDAVRSDDMAQAMESVRTMENRLRQMRAMSEEGRWM